MKGICQFSMTYLLSSNSLPVLLNFSVTFSCETIINLLMTVGNEDDLLISAVHLSMCLWYPSILSLACSLPLRNSSLSSLLSLSSSSCPMSHLCLWAFSAFLSMLHSSLSFLPACNEDKLSIKLKKHIGYNVSFDLWVYKIVTTHYFFKTNKHYLQLLLLKGLVTIPHWTPIWIWLNKLRKPPTLFCIIK